MASRVWRQILQDFHNFFLTNLNIWLQFFSIAYCFRDVFITCMPLLALTGFFVYRIQIVATSATRRYARKYDVRWPRIDFLQSLSLVNDFKDGGQHGQ